MIDKKKIFEALKIEEGDRHWVGSTEPILLSEAGREWMIDVKDNYGVQFARNDEMEICVGFTLAEAGARFEHPAIIRKEGKDFNFKHYRPNGSKCRTSQKGMELYFRVPGDKILLLPWKGMSYVAALINGAPVMFDVSGGTHNGGWRDWIREVSHLCINIPMESLKLIAAAAILPPGSVAVEQVEMLEAAA